MIVPVLSWARQVKAFRHKGTPWEVFATHWLIFAQRWSTRTCKPPGSSTFAHSGSQPLKTTGIVPRTSVTKHGKPLPEYILNDCVCHLINVYIGKSGRMHGGLIFIVKLFTNQQTYETPNKNGGGGLFTIYRR